MADIERAGNAEKLRYVADMLGELGRMLPSPGRSTLAYFVEMARLQAEADMLRAAGAPERREDTH